MLIISVGFRLTTDLHTQFIKIVCQTDAKARCFILGQQSWLLRLQRTRSRRIAGGCSDIIFQTVQQYPVEMLIIRDKIKCNEKKIYPRQKLKKSESWKFLGGNFRILLFDCLPTGSFEVRIAAVFLWVAMPSAKRTSTPANIVTVTDATPTWTDYYEIIIQLNYVNSWGLSSICRNTNIRK